MTETPRSRSERLFGDYSLTPDDGRNDEARRQLEQYLAGERRDFDLPPLSRAGVLSFPYWRSRAREWIAEYGVKTRGEGAPIRSLSGGNVQRAVLARELAGDINVLIAANPVFGLDFAAVAEIHSRIVQVREKGGAVLLVSEDLDELLELADRIIVMSEGRIVFETSAAGAQRHVIGAHMGGGHHEGAV